MTKIVQSKELTDFYNAYNNWLEAGAPEENKYNFTRYYGLCNAIHGYKHKNKIKADLVYQQDILFHEANLDNFYPFGRENYFVYNMEHRQHLDPNRIRWVKAHLTEEVDKEFTLQD